MLTNLEHAVVAVALVWAAVQLLKHFLPSSYERAEKLFYNHIENRLSEVEKKLGLNND